MLRNNHMHEIGVTGKQTSCVFHSLASNTTIESNVCYNGPRAGINWNDGHGGGNTLQHNLVFNVSAKLCPSTCGVRLVST